MTCIFHPCCWSSAAQRSITFEPIIVLFRLLLWLYSSLVLVGCFEFSCIRPMHDNLCDEFSVLPDMIWSSKAYFCTVLLYLLPCNSRNCIGTRFPAGVTPVHLKGYASFVFLPSYTSPPSSVQCYHTCLLKHSILTVIWLNGFFILWCGTVGLCRMDGCSTSWH